MAAVHAASHHHSAEPFLQHVEDRRTADPGYLAKGWVRKFGNRFPKERVRFVRPGVLILQATVG